MIYVSFFVGLLLICKGGDWFVDAASAIARALGIPKYIVGATIVSFATTMPEILVSVAAALKGSAVMAIGNAVGSVSANTGIILGVSLFCLPSVIDRREYLTKNILYLGCLLLLFISFRDRSFDAGDCLFLLGGGILFLLMNVKNAMTGRTERSVCPEERGRFRDVFVFLLWALPAWSSVQSFSLTRPVRWPDSFRSRRRSFPSPSLPWALPFRSLSPPLPLF